MTTGGWTIAMACEDFDAAGIPVTPRQLSAIIRQLPGFTRIGELRKPAGSEGGRGHALYTIGELQELITVLHDRGWLVPSSGDTRPPSLDAGLLSSILALEPYARPLPGCGCYGPRGLSPWPRTIGSLSGPAVHAPPDAGPDAYPEDTMDYTERTVLIPAGTTITGAVVALTEPAGADGPVLAELRIDGPPVQ